MADKTTVDCSTGQLRTDPLTAEEQSQQAADAAVTAELAATEASEAARVRALPVAARLAVVDKVRADVLTDDEVSTVAALFPALVAGLDVQAGEVYQWDGTLVEVIQPHTTQQGWIDTMNPSLFKVHRTYGVVTDWAQPSGAHDAYSIGEAVRYADVVYTSQIDANTTTPGTDDRWWLPVN